MIKESLVSLHTVCPGVPASLRHAPKHSATSTAWQAGDEQVHAQLTEGVAHCPTGCACRQHNTRKPVCVAHTPLSCHQQQPHSSCGIVCTPSAKRPHAAFHHAPSHAVTPLPPLIKASPSRINSDPWGLCLHVP